MPPTTDRARHRSRAIETGSGIPSLTAASVLAGLTFAGASALASDGEAAGATATYTSTVPVALRSDRAPSPARLTVTGAGTTVTDVDVALAGLSHGDPADVDLLLVGPDGQQAVLLSDAYAAGSVRDADLVLDDEAVDRVPTPVVPGTYRPTDVGATPDTFGAPGAERGSSLAVFDGTNPNGTWRLYAADDTAGRRGRLQGWSLRITTVSPGDAVHPRVVTTTPGSRADGVAAGTRIRLTLSEAVRPGTVTPAAVRLVTVGTGMAVPTAVTWHPDTRSLVVEPEHALEPRTTYQVVLTPAVRDHAGNALDQDPTTTGSQPHSSAFTVR